MNKSVATVSGHAATISLRNLLDADVDWILEAGRDPSIQRLTSHGGARTPESARALIHGTNGDHNSWAILLNSQPVGVISVHSIDVLASVADVGFWVDPAFRRRGAARGALELLERELALDVTVEFIQLTIAQENHASQRVAVACGFELISEGDCACGSGELLPALVFRKRV